MLRGKCADCGSQIAFRYFLVELVTALLFLACWRMHPPVTAAGLFLMMALLVAVTWIDVDHFIIPLSLTTMGSVGALCFALSPTNALHFVNPLPADAVWWQSMWDAGLGWVAGFFLLWFVVLVGKMAFGKKRVAFDEAAAWHLEDGDENTSVTLHLDGEVIPWEDLFYRKSDVLSLECSEIYLNEEKIPPGLLQVSENQVIAPTGETFELEKVKSLRGFATKAVIPREAMGMGDPHLLGMIGAFLGGHAVIFTVAASAFFALGAALLGKVGFGKPLPFGPFLSLGAVTWALGGWRIWEWYCTHFLALPL